MYFLKDKCKSMYSGFARIVTVALNLLLRFVGKSDENSAACLKVMLVMVEAKV